MVRQQMIKKWTIKHLIIKNVKTIGSFDLYIKYVKYLIL